MAIMKIKTYAIGSSSGIFRINRMITSATPRMQAIPIIPPIRTITGLLEMAREANTESIEKMMSIISICATTDQNNRRPVRW